MIFLSPTEWLAVAVAVFVGTAIQGALGFGMVVIALPVLLLVDPELVPGTILCGGWVVPGYLAWRHWGSPNWREIITIMIARIPGLTVGAVALRLLDQRQLALVAATGVLVAVGASSSGWHIRRTPLAVSLAGFFSGFLGSVAAIGGPPTALLYQRESGPDIRSALSVLNAMGIGSQILAVSLAGAIDRDDVVTGLSLTPAMVAGLVAAPVVIRHSDSRLRPMVLGVCAVAALTVLVRTLLG